MFLWCPKKKQVTVTVLDSEEELDKILIQISDLMDKAMVLKRLKVLPKPKPRRIRRSPRIREQNEKWQEWVDSEYDHITRAKPSSTSDDGESKHEAE